MCALRKRGSRVAPIFLASLWLLTGLAGSAGAQTNPFSINGQVSLADNSGIPGATVVNGTSNPAEPNNSTKELGPLNGSTTKVYNIHLDEVPTLGETNPNNALDLNTVFTQTHKDDEGYQWYYFGYIKDSANGSGFVAIELQQNELGPECDYTQPAADLIASCNPWRGRSEGDKMLLFDFQGSGQELILRTFKQDSVTGQVYLPSCPQGFPTNQKPGECETVPGVNFIAMYGKAANGSLDRSRGEVAINLTNVLFGGLDSVSCRNFATIIPNTVTGNSDTADYKDTVLFPFPDISNCGTVTVKKVITPFAAAYADDLFTYTLENDGSQIFDGGGIPAQCESGSSETICVGTVKHDDGDGSEIDEIKNVLAGTGFTLAESPFAGYSSTIVCTFKGTEYSSDPQAGQEAFPFPVEADEVTSCVITNTRLRGTLRITKRLINDNGGTATLADFVINRGDGGTPEAVLGSVSADGLTFVPTPAGYSEYQYDTGQTFSISETGASGYSQTSIVLTKYDKDGGVLAGPTAGCAGTIEADVVFHCVITNDDQAGSLQIVKVVVNDNGGTATAASFGLNTTAGALSFGAGVESPANTFTYTSAALTVSAGNYTLRENDIAGYVEGTWSCTGATPSDTSIGAGAVTVPNGGTVVCTITNDDQAGSLQIVKVVVNDNGGTATAASFGLSTTAGALSFAAGVESPANTFTYTSGALTVNAGSYTLRENDIAGYTEGTWSCTGATPTDTSISAGSVTVPNGGTVVCTITNNDLMAMPSGYTVQRAVLHDSFKIDAGIRRGPGETGLPMTVTFRLYADDQCGTQVGEDETVNFVFNNNQDGGTAVTINGILVEVGPTYYWRALFSGNNFNQGFATVCGSEKVDLTFTDTLPQQQP